MSGTRSGDRSNGKRSAGPSGRVGERAFRRQAQRTVHRDERQRVRRRMAATRRPVRAPLRQHLARVPRIAWICAAIACVNAICWSVVSPPFEVPDEPEHVAYVKQLAETGSLPIHTDAFSTEENVALQDTHLQEAAEHPQFKTIASRAQNKTLQSELKLAAAEHGGAGSPGAGVAASQPPLYYALEAIPYTLAGGTLLDRIAAMRLFSAFLGGLTALFVYLFLREALPEAPWAATTGGLAVALAPLLGFMSGAVNPDAMLFAVSAGLFYLLARGFKRGFTRKLAVALGALTAVGFMTKLNFVGIAPGVLIGIVVLALREPRVERRNALLSMLISLCVAFSPVVLYVIVQAASGHTTLISSALDGVHGSVSGRLSYIWQLYLPRLPGMRDYFAGLFTTRQLWFNAYVGQLGWLDTPFPGWVETLALIPAALILGLCVRALVVDRSALRSRLFEIVVYAVMAVGLMILIGASGYLQLPRADAEFAQARYLLPLIPLLGLVLALAARGAGRRWGPAVGAAIVLLFLAHDLFSQLQVIARYYG
jgi:Predicted membrane protein (DUF2142)